MIAGGAKGYARTLVRGLTALALAAGVVVWAIWVFTLGPGTDVHAYYRVDASDPYRVAIPGAQDAFLYSPAFAQATAPLRALPEPLFTALWRTTEVVALFAMTGPWAVAFALVPPVVGEIRAGNIHLLLALAIVMGFRRPWLWSLVLLTKLTPGIGLVWFAARREWRSLAVAVCATATIAVASFVVAPHTWSEWFDVLSRVGAPPSGPSVLAIPLLPRIVVAGVLVAWGARTDRRWVVPIAGAVALPVLWVAGLSTALGAIPLAFANGRLPFRGRG